jgi:hypothetical protein
LGPIPNPQSPIPIKELTDHNIKKSNIIYHIIFMNIY